MTYQRFKAFTSVETMIAVTCAILITVPAVNNLFTQITAINRLETFTGIEQQANYILMLIQDELTFSHVNNDWIPSNEEEEISLLAFTRNDGKYVRYYLRNSEIVKDYNYSVYNAVSTKIFNSFRVRRTDHEQCFIIHVALTTIQNTRYEQSYYVKKTSN
jgi:hypothetical protein